MPVPNVKWNSCSQLRHLVMMHSPMDQSASIRGGSLGWSLALNMFMNGRIHHGDASGPPKIDLLTLSADAQPAAY